MEMPSETLSLRVLICKDGDWWIARGVEHDIAAQTKRISDLAWEFERVMMTHVVLDVRDGIVPLSRIPPAPSEVEDAWMAGVEHKPERPPIGDRDMARAIAYDTRLGDVCPAM